MRYDDGHLTTARLRKRVTDNEQLEADIRRMNGEVLPVDDRLDSLAAMQKSYLAQHPGGKIRITDAMREDWAAANPALALKYSRAQVDETLTAEWRRAGDELAKAILDAQVAASYAPVRAGQLKKAAAITSNLRSSQSKSDLAELERAYDRRDVLNQTEPTRTQADNRERYELPIKIAKLEMRLCSAPGFR